MSIFIDMSEFKTEAKASNVTLKLLFKEWFKLYFMRNKGWNVKVTKSGYKIFAPDGEGYSIHRSNLSVDNLFNFIKRKTGILQNDLKLSYKNGTDPFKK